MTGPRSDKTAKRCYKCGANGKCFNSRDVGEGRWRRYKCHRGHRWTTIELMTLTGKGRSDGRSMHRNGASMKALRRKLLADAHRRINALFRQLMQ